MKLGSSIVVIALGIALLLPSVISAAKPVRTPIEHLFEITNIDIDASGNPVLFTIDVENISSNYTEVTAGIWSSIAWAHVCPGHSGLSGTMTPILDCTADPGNALNTEGTQSIPPGGVGTVEFEFPMSIEPGMDYVFFTQVVCSGRGVKCEGYLHSFFGLDQTTP